MAQSHQSKRWLREHFSDHYVKQAQKSGYRSRAAFKLLEIHQKDQLIKPGMTIIDLGAAPGGWSQVAAKLLKGRGQIIALDILPMDPMPDVNFIQGDFREEACFNQLLDALEGKMCDLVICDMAPNMSGMNAIDQPRAMFLAQIALELVQRVLKEEGAFLIKLFHGAGFDEYLRQLKQLFKVVSARKPGASRARSRETYCLAKGFKRGQL